MKQMSSNMVRLAMVASMGWILMACLGAPESTETVGQSSQAIGETCLSDADCANGYCDFSRSDDPSLGGRCNSAPGCGAGTNSPCVDIELGGITFTAPATYCAS